LTASRGGSEEARQLADLAGFAVLGAILAPARLVRAGPTACLVRRATGLPCPACGLTRSWNAAGRLDLRRSLADHPLGLVTLALAAYWATREPEAGATVPAPGRAALAALAIAWLGVWLVRLRAALLSPAAR